MEAGRAVLRAITLGVGVAQPTLILTLETYGGAHLVPDHDVPEEARAALSSSDPAPVGPTPLRMRSAVQRAAPQVASSVGGGRTAEEAVVGPTVPYVVHKFMLRTRYQVRSIAGHE